MTPFQAYKHYLAIKAHFTRKDYDAIEYNYKTRASPKSFNNRQDKAFFYKLSRHSDLTGLLVSLFIRNPELWVGDIVIGFHHAEQIYTQWKGRCQRLEYNFINDCKKLDLKTCLKTTKDQHPDIIIKMLREEITIETVAILVELTGALINLKKKLDGDVIFDQYSLVLAKYRPFLLYDRKRYVTILKQLIEEQQTNKVV